MAYQTLKQFVDDLKARGDLKHIAQPVDPALEMTEISRRALERDGPALLFESPVGGGVPVVTNLFASQRRIALGLGLESISELRRFGELLASLKDPEPPRNLREIWGKLPLFRRALAMAPKKVRNADCYDNCISQQDVDLHRLPVQTCWPEDAGPLITWGLVITKNPETGRHNLGVYRYR